MGCVVASDGDDLARQDGRNESNLRCLENAALRRQLAERVAIEERHERALAYLAGIRQAFNQPEEQVVIDGNAADSHERSLSTHGLPSCRRALRSSPNITASSSARHDAAMTFSCTPTVDHSLVPSLVPTRTRVTAPVPEAPSRIRTL